MKYCIIGFEYNNTWKLPEFYVGVKDDILQTTDDWDRITYFKHPIVAEQTLDILKEDFSDYGWYIMIC